MPARVAHRVQPGGSMVISTPAGIDALARKIPQGKLATINTLREALASPRPRPKPHIKAAAVAHQREQLAAHAVVVL